MTRTWGRAVRVRSVSGALCTASPRAPCGRRRAYSHVPVAALANENKFLTGPMLGPATRTWSWPLGPSRPEVTSRGASPNWGACRKPGSRKRPGPGSGFRPGFRPSALFLRSCQWNKSSLRHLPRCLPGRLPVPGQWRARGLTTRAQRSIWHGPAELREMEAGRVPAVGPSQYLLVCVTVTVAWRFWGKGAIRCSPL